MNTKPITRRVAGRIYAVEVPVEQQGEDLVVTGDDLKRAELAIAARLAREGPVHGETFRFMRGALGLTAQAVAKMLAVAPETISRWEKGVRDVDQAAWVALAGRALHRAGHPAAEPLSMPLVPAKGPRIVRLPMGWRRELDDAVWVLAPWMTSETLRTELVALGFEILSFEKVNFSSEDAMRVSPPLTAAQRLALEELAPIGVPLANPIALPRRPDEQIAR